MSTIKTTNITHGSNSGTANVVLDSSGNATVNGNLTVTGTGLYDNTPAFSVTKSGDQSISQNTWTKVEWETEQFDTDNAFDNTNDKFTVPAGKGGVYQLNVQVCVTNQTENAELDLKVYKNGSATSTPSFSREYPGTSGNSNNTTQLHHLYDLNAADYLEIYVSTGSGGSYVIESDSSCWSMFRLLGTS